MILTFTSICALVGKREAQRVQEGKKGWWLYKKKNFKAVLLPLYPVWQILTVSFEFTRPKSNLRPSACQLTCVYVCVCGIFESYFIFCTKWLINVRKKSLMSKLNSALVFTVLNHSLQFLCLSPSSLNCFLTSFHFSVIQSCSDWDWLMRRSYDLVTEAAPFFVN